MQRLLFFFFGAVGLFFLSCQVQTEAIPGPRGEPGPTGSQGPPGQQGVPGPTSPAADRAWLNSLTAICQTNDAATATTIAAVARPGHDGVTASQLCASLVNDLALGGTVWADAYEGLCVSVGYEYNSAGDGVVAFSNAVLASYSGDCSKAPTSFFPDGTWATETTEGFFACCN